MNKWFFLLILTLSFPAWAYRSQDTRILAECQWNKELYGLEADCNDLFHHYFPQNKNYNPSSDKVRFGSFNIYKMGYSDAKFKRLDLLAQLMNARWDVIALSEVQHNAADNLRYNVNALRALDKGKIDKTLALKAYTKPSYLKLLQNLQALDPSWGLILSPFGQNPNHKSPSDELYAFLYRNTQVKPLPSQYCKKHLNSRSSLNNGKIALHKWMSTEAKKGVQKVKPDQPANLDHDFKKPETETIACLLDLKGDERKYFPRIPLVASFKSGHFDFTYFSLHLRFRSPDMVPPGKCEDACMKTLTKMAHAAGAPDYYDVAKLKAKPVDQEPRLSGDDLKEIARMFEAYVTLKEATKVSEINGDKDVIITGDFNLEHFDLPASNVTADLNGTSGPLISILDVLPGSKSYISKKTSISKKFGIEGKLLEDGSRQGGGNSYDHFILVNKTGYTSECDTSSIQRVDFVKDASVKAQMQIQGVAFDEYYKDPDNFDDIVDWSLQSFFGNKVRIDSSGNSIALDDSSLTSRDLIDKYNNCITGAKKEKMTLREGLAMDLRCQLLWHSEQANQPILSRPDREKTKEPFRIYTGTLSDHIPVEMTCTLPSSDDD